jgi:hypothetical protein
MNGKQLADWYYKEHSANGIEIRIAFYNNVLNSKFQRVSNQFIEYFWERMNELLPS